MIVIASYLAKVALCSAVLYTYYFIALRNNRFHQWNRYYLILITLLSLIVPFFQIPLPAAPSSPSMFYSYTEKMVTLGQTVAPQKDPGLLLRTGVMFIYGAIIIFLLARLLMNIVHIRQLVRRNNVQHIPPCRFVKGEEIQAPFSFFNYIFWNNNIPLETEEGRQILRHEMVHLRDKHSADKLLLEIITSIYWINPFFHIIKRELALIHEFIADNKAAGEEVPEYAQTILQMAFQSKQLTIVNSFFHPPLMRRINMLTQFRTPRFSYMRRLLVLPLIAFVFCSLTFCTNKQSSAIRPLSVKNGEQTSATSQKEEVFTFVEYPPKYPGGEEELARYLSHNIRYPRQAQENGISGTVFVQFVVDKEGYIKDPRVVGKTRGGGLEEEALRVIAEMPRWVPGTQNGQHVAVQFNLPIRFTLQE
ncbi:MAG TPA: M56 family metallopeptidase [Chitinophaga sp.]|uniref:M56 family metallopeptidase n=1 Tax=Chitinophaga sp. TaxID=1869181 RepID=UPI002B692AB9|nr:M56 family metallopeptidase [Chitinophaga sp.]HVI44889.1 M56 family metallopeptidase [Chitinophaga sp.]